MYKVGIVTASCTSQITRILALMYQVIQSDVDAKNGVVFGIDRVLFPPPEFKKVIWAPSPELEQFHKNGTTAKKPAAAKGQKNVTAQEGSP